MYLSIILYCQFFYRKVFLITFIKEIMEHFLGANLLKFTAYIVTSPNAPKDSIWKSSGKMIFFLGGLES